FAATIVPVGWYWRDAAFDARGRLRGRGAVLGVRMGYEYGEHDYDRARAETTVRDLVAIASPIGVHAEHVLEHGALSVRTGLEVAGSIAGVRPWALPMFVAARGSRDGLGAATRSNGYYHALGVSAAPFVELSIGEVRLRGRTRFD